MDTIHTGEGRDRRREGKNQERKGKRISGLIYDETRSLALTVSGLGIDKKKAGHRSRAIIQMRACARIQTEIQKKVVSSEGEHALRLVLAMGGTC